MVAKCSCLWDLSGVGEIFRWVDGPITPEYYVTITNQY